MIDVSAFGTKCYLLASTTYPTGFTIRNFADDVDPIILDPIIIAQSKRDVNGKFYSSGKGAVIPVSISVIAGSSEEVSLATIVRSNFNSTAVRPAMDEINLTLSYQDGTVVIFTQGRMISGPPSPSIVMSGRSKSSTFIVHFGGVSTNNIKSTIRQGLGSIIGAAASGLFS